MIETAQYKTRLEALLQDVTEELQSLGIKNPQNPDDWIAIPEREKAGEADLNVAADVSEDWAERRATLSQLEVRYANITRALRKIEEGTYGLCEVGEEQIETDRLDAHPAARTCKAHMDTEENLPL